MGAAALPGKSLQLRLVVSSVDSACSAPALSSDGPASACDRAGVTTYELAKSLGVDTPTSVELTLVFGSTSEAKQVAADVGASATP